MKKHRWFSVLIVVSVFIVGAIAYQVGYSRGSRDQDLRQIPFNLVTTLQIYEMCNSFNSPNKAALSPQSFTADSAKKLICMEIYAYDANRKRFEELGLGGDRFEEALKKGRSIVSDLDLDLAHGEDLESLVKRKLNSRAKAGVVLDGERK